MHDDFKFTLDGIDEQILELSLKLKKIDDAYELARSRFKPSLTRGFGMPSPYSNSKYCLRVITFIGDDNVERCIKTFEKNKTAADVLKFRKITLEALRRNNAIEIVSDEQVNDERYHLSKYSKEASACMFKNGLEYI